MAEERIVERTDANGNVERTVDRGAGGTTVVERRGGGGGLVIGALLLVGIAVLAFFLLDLNKQEARESDAIADAAGAVEDGAKQVGDAADRAADKLTDGN